VVRSELCFQIFLTLHLFFSSSPAPAFSLSLLEFYQVDNLDNLDLSSDNLDLDLIPITRLKCTMSQYQTSPGMPLFFF